MHHHKKASYRIPQHTHTTVCLRIWSTHVLLCLDCTNQPIVDDLVREAVMKNRNETKSDTKHAKCKVFQTTTKQHDTQTTTTTTSLTLRGAARRHSGSNGFPMATTMVFHQGTQLRVFFRAPLDAFHGLAFVGRLGQQRVGLVQHRIHLHQ